MSGRKRIEKRTTRTTVDAVTHAVTDTDLDPARVAFEAITGVLENAWGRLFDAVGAARADKFMVLLDEWVKLKRPHKG